MTARAISEQRIRAAHPLTAPQMGVWLEQHVAADPAFHNNAEFLRIETPLDVSVFTEALQYVVDRTDALRIRLSYRGELPEQKVISHVPCGLEIVDCRQSERAEAAAREWMQADAQQPFHLDGERLFQFALLRVADSTTFWYYKYHHVIMDGAGLAIVAGRVAGTYTALKQGVEPQWESDLAWTDVIQDDITYAASSQKKQDRDFWLAHCRDLPRPVTLATRRAPANDPGRAGRIGAPLPPHVLMPLHELAKALAGQGVKHFHVLYALLHSYLARLTGETDLSIGLPRANRPAGPARATPGMCATLITPRVQFPHEGTLGELIAAVSATLSECVRHDRYPLQELVRELTTFGAERTTPFSVVFNYMPFAYSFGFFESPPVERELITAPFWDLQFIVREDRQSGDGRIDIHYPENLYSATEVALHRDRFLHLLQSAPDHLETPLSRLPIIPPAERQKMLVEWNDTRRDYPRDQCVHELFEQTASASPCATAVHFGGDRLTYGELDASARALAGHLCGLGVGRGSRVGLCLERSSALVVALLGVLKAGAAYVPLDPDLPAERLRYILEDAAVDALVTSKAASACVAEKSVPTLVLDADLAMDIAPSDSPFTQVTADDPAYVIYTSGSTGRPKGVEVLHRNVVNFLESMRRQPGFGAEDVLLAVTTITFDIAALELFLPLTVGGKVVIAPAEAVVNGERLQQLLEAHNISVMQATPATWQLLIQSGWRGRRGLKMLCGGEALPRPLADALLERGGDLWNMYGPTETTIWSATCKVQRDGPVSIGQPIANTQLYVLDPQFQPVPQGVVGELCIGGDGVARGYLGRPELTAERFVDDPFRDESDAQMYRTGDLVRYDEAGQLLFLGRADHQVKLRGFRIELGEIESVVVDYPAVEQAAVLIEGHDAEEQRLTAYVVSPSATSPAELRRYLAEVLPEYMVPASFVFIESMPLTPSGKIDRKRLVELEARPISELASIAPRGPVEQGLAAAFGELLGCTAIGAHDNFFHLGGHSLLATRLLSQLRAAFEVELPLSAIFEAPTVAGLAVCIERARRTDWAATSPPPIEPSPRPNRLPLSSAQQRLWFLHQLGAAAAYNMLLSLRFEGRIDEHILHRVLAAVTKRHEVLRTTFSDDGGRPFQRIAPAVQVPLEIVDVSHRSPGDDEREASRLAGEDLRRPFDLSSGPLLRAMVVRMGNTDALFLTIHHSICDGWSLGLLRREIAEHYRAFTEHHEPQLPLLPVQYADFALWQSSWLDEHTLGPQLEYWKRQLGGELPVLELPIDRPRPPVQTFRGSSRTVEIIPELFQALRGFNHERGVTMAMTLLAAFKVLLSRYSGQDDIVVGSPIAGRVRTEIEHLVGFFVNNLVLRTDLSGDPSFETVLQRVKQTALVAYDHQDLPFERLVEELDPHRDLSRNPLFQIVFAMQSEDPSTTDVPSSADSGFHSFPTDLTVTRTDIELHLFEQRDQLQGRLVYNTDLFDDQTIERMIAHYLRLLQEAVSNPAAPVGQLSMLSDDERRQLLLEWNRTASPFPQDRCVHELIEQRAAETPGSSAVVFGDREITYGQLNATANQLAHTLRAMGVQPDTLVGLCVERGPEMIVGLLGILKAGGAYVPIDPAYPRERLAFMLSDCGAPALVTQAHLLEALPEHGAQCLCLDRDWPAIAAAPTGNPQLCTTPQNLAYAIYTSGSTGRPKAALLEHRGLSSLSEAQRRAFGITSDSRVLQFSSLSFDASTFEIMMALPKGATLYLGTRDELQPGPELLDFLRRHEITIVTLTPTVLAALPHESLAALKTITVAGEACPPELVARWGPGRRFFNLYGPTETTIWATMAELQPDSGTVHVGRPIANTQTYILNRHLEPVPIGVPGELHIGGVGLARGYHGRPELTEERFIANPFRSGERLYKTGDQARYRADGNIEFLGRMDDQVKLRGFRIELGEIESVLETHPAIREAAALVHEGREEHADRPDDRRIVAYVVNNENGNNGDAIDRVFQEDLVSHWQSLYEQAYRDAPTPKQAEFNIAGWNSSYTDEPLPAEEMRDWVDRTVERIVALRPDRVLEIGCGTGLMLFGVVPHCARYVGTDFSAAALDYVARQLDRRDGHTRFADVTLERCAADELVGAAAAEQFDTVILNSVAQYFPSADYLARVLQGAAARVRRGGRIFVGDVRSLPLLRAFHTSVQLHRINGDLDTEQLRRRIHHHMTHEQELVVDPAFFFVLEQSTPRLAGVEILPKRGRYDNELSRFRYDVILHIDDASPAPLASPMPEPLDWQREGLTVERLRTRLREQQPPSLSLARVPNARTQRHALSAQLLDPPDAPATAQSLQIEVELQLAQTPAVDPETLFQLADELKYDLCIDWTGGSSDGSFNATFCHTTETSLPPLQRPSHVPTDYVGLTNNPLSGRRLSSLVPQLREHARALLPEYMVPSTFVLMDRLPVSPSGKLDRRALPMPDTLRPELAAAYTAPRTPVEATLTRVWQEVLNLEQVGIHDNFFELGGDSIQSVQVVAAAREAGLQVMTRDLFQHQTVAGLATVARPTQRTDIEFAEDPPAVGEVPLTAIQQWFFEQDLAEPHHFNQAVLLEAAEPIESGHLQLVLDAVIDHHDALRLRFKQCTAGWCPRVVESAGRTPLSLFDLSTVPQAERHAFIEAQSSQLQASLNLMEGPICRVAVFTANDEPHDRLLWIIHHLAVDGVSWRILLEDLQRGLDQLRSGQTVQLPVRTNSIKTHATHMHEYAQTAAVATEVAYWLNRPWHEIRPLPLDDCGDGVNTVARTDSVRVGLSPEQTRALLHEVPQAYGTRINDVLLTALARACVQWTKHPWLLLDLEGHGRTPIFDDLDLSRTVGWFTSIYPLLLHWEGQPQQAWDPGTALKSVKEQIRAVQHDGIGYGVARHLGHDESIKQQLCSHPRAQLSFNYLGQLDSTWGRGAAFARCDIPIGPSRSPAQQRVHLLEINGAVSDERLQMTWTYSRQCHRRATIHAVAQEFVAALSELIAHCTTANVEGYTPSDFAELDVSQEQLDDILGKLDG